MTLRRIQLFFLFTLIALIAGVKCTQKEDAPYTIELIRPVPGHCTYELQAKTLWTLEDLTHMAGRMGKVVFHPDDILSRNAILAEGQGFEPVDVRFAKANGIYTALDYRSLYAASLYSAVEATVERFASLSEKANLEKLIPHLRETRIVYRAELDARRLGGKGKMTDNALFMGLVDRAGGDPGKILHYIISFPAKDMQGLPIGLNAGIIGHETTHFVNYYLWRNRLKLSSQDSLTANTVASVDEGMADYAGFVISGDPNFLECSMPNLGRDLTKAKTVTDVQKEALEKNLATFTPYDTGAVFAATQYQIGELIGHEQNLKALVTAFSGKCIVSDNKVTFQKIIGCHRLEVGGRAAEVESIYQKAFSVMLGNQS